MTLDLSIVAEPLDELHCRFLVTPPVPGPSRRYTDQDAADSALAQAVFSVPGVCELTVDGGALVLRKGEGTPSWVVLEPRVRYALGMALSGEPGPEPAPSDAGPPDDDAIYEQVSRMLDREINPAVARHGGAVELVDVQDGTVLVRLSGGCQGCGMASVTLRQGIEASLRRAIPDLRGLTDLTDHASGTRPYFSAASK